MRGSGLGLATALGVLAAAASAQARIVHDGGCPSGFASDVPGRHACIAPSRIVHDRACRSGLRARAGGASQCVPVYELSRNVRGLHGRTPRHERIVHD